MWHTSFHAAHRQLLFVRKLEKYEQCHMCQLTPLVASQWIRTTRRAVGVLSQIHHEVFFHARFFICTRSHSFICSGDGTCSLRCPIQFYTGVYFFYIALGSSALRMCICRESMASDYGDAASAGLVGSDRVDYRDCAFFGYHWSARGSHCGANVSAD